MLEGPESSIQKIGNLLPTGKMNTRFKVMNEAEIAGKKDSFSISF